MKHVEKYPIYEKSNTLLTKNCLLAYSLMQQLQNVTFVSNPFILP